MARSILAVFLGVVLAVLIVAGVEFLGGLVYPPPAGFDLADPEAVKAVMAKMPAGALWFVPAAWASSQIVLPEARPSVVRGGRVQ